MGFKKGDKVLVITGSDEEGYVVTPDEVVSSGATVSLSKHAEKFEKNGKHKAKKDSIVLATGGLNPQTSQSAFVKSAGKIDGIRISKERVKKLKEGA